MAKEGWAWPIRAARPHYFVDGRSLCGKWGYFGEVSEEGPKEEEYECVCRDCAKKLERRRQNK